MFKTKQPYYNELSREQRLLFTEIFSLITEFNYLMQIVKVAHSSEVSEPYRVAVNFYTPLFANIQINFENVKKDDFVYLSKLLIHLEGRFHSGMIQKAMKAYNVLTIILKKLTEFTDNFQD